MPIINKKLMAYGRLVGRYHLPTALSQNSRKLE